MARQTDFATSPENRRIMELVYSSETFGRPYLMAPDNPADRVAALRKAFDALMKDPAFLADAKKRKLEIGPHNATQITALVNKISSASPELITRVKKAIGQIE